MSNIITAGNATNNGTSISSDTSGVLELKTGSTPTTAIAVDASQNVGVGTSSPGYKLDIVGAGAPSNGVMRISSNFTNSSTKYGYYTVGNYTNANLPFGFICGESNSTENNVHIGGGAGEVTAATRIDFYTAANNTTTNGTERMRIDSSGNLLVGSTTNSNNAKVKVYKTGNRPTIEAEQGDSGGYNFQSIAVNNGGTYYHCNFQEGGTQRGSISSNGSNTAYNTGSDYRLKDGVAPMTGALNKISGLNPVTWKWKSNGSDGQGFIAHELAEVCPDAVTGKKDAVDENGNPVYQMVDVSYLVATLTAAIQELKAELDATKAEVAALKGA